MFLSHSHFQRTYQRSATRHKIKAPAHLGAGPLTINASSETSLSQKNDLCESLFCACLKPCEVDAR